MTSQKDISNRSDIVALLQHFYKKATADPVIGVKFKDLDMDDHIETIADFWEMILLGGAKYKGDPFGKHIPLNLQPEHFSIWVNLFHETVNEMFVGTNAEEAKTRASTISKVFQHKLRFN